MRTDYHQIFEVRVYHNFFKDGLYSDLLVTPDDFTSLLLKKYRLRWRSEGNRHYLFTGNWAGEVPSLAYVNGEINLRFKLESRTPFFYNITELGHSESYSSIITFNNLRTATSSEEPALLTYEVADRSALSTWTNGVIGYMDITIGGKQPNAIPLPKQWPIQDQDVVKYRIHFESRAVTWRYYIINRRKQAIRDVSLLDGVSPLPFSGGGSVMLRSKYESAIMIELTDVHRLSETSSLKPLLVIREETESGSERLLNFQLPTPDFRRITPEGRGQDQRTYADMYFYL